MLIMLLILAFSLGLFVEHHLVIRFVQLRLLFVHILDLLLERTTLLFFNLPNTLQFLLECYLFIDVFL